MPKIVGILTFISMIDTTSERIKDKWLSPAITDIFRIWIFQL